MNPARAEVRESIPRIGLGTWQTFDVGDDKAAREALFTVVPRSERYKAKNFIDTVVYRGGDALSGWVFGKLGAAASNGAA